MNSAGLAGLSATLLILPFLIGWIHNCNASDKQYTLITYRYFVVFNVVLSGLSVCARTLGTHPFSPSHDMVVAAILAMVIFSSIAIWQRDSIRVAPAFIWGLFVLFGAAFHLAELLCSPQTINNPAMLWLHIVYDCLVFAILMILAAKLLRSRR